MIELGHDLPGRLAELERKVDWLTRRDVLANASIDQGGLDVNDGAINVKSGQAINILNGGSLNVNGGGSVNILGGGHAYVNGLQLSAVRASVIQGWASGYAVPVTDTNVVSATVTVPTGYTQALLFVNGEAQFANDTTGMQMVQSGLNATSTSGSVAGIGPGMDIPVSSGGTNTMTCTLANIISGISASAGQTITITGYVVCGAALGTNAYNAFGLTGIAIFLA